MRTSPILGRFRHPNPTIDLRIPPFTFGVGDRFAHQAEPQLRAFEMIARDGVDVYPVWNKSNREHNFVGSTPPSVRQAAQRAVENLDWSGPWFVDADHINLDTVDPFLDNSDFFTIDVADAIGAPSSDADLDAFVDRHGELIGDHQIDGIDRPVSISKDQVRSVAAKYLAAANRAGEVCRHIESAKGKDQFIAEVSMDETEDPQTPPELWIILAAIADAGVPIQTIAPKFTGRFNKGVDYVGDLSQFEQEFSDDVAVLRHAVKCYGLPDTLKLSVHSGSDKFSLYPIIRRVVDRTGAGLHLKTAGTTWLEEIIGLAEAGGDGLDLAKEIYAHARGDVQGFCAPYASVIDIEASRLPSADEVNTWDGPRLAAAIRHVPDNPEFNADMRQLLHVSFKIAAKQGSRYTDLLKSNADIVGRHVTTNLYERHMKRLFLS